MICKASLRGLALTSFILIVTVPLHAQENKSTAQDAKVAEAQRMAFQMASVDRAYTLHNEPAQFEQNELLTAVRNMSDPQTKIFLMPSQNVIVVHAPEAEQQRIAKLITTLDQPHPRYRLTYTFTELDGTRRIGVQHYSVVVLDGQRIQMKEGSRIPISVGGNQITYIDVGMSFDLTLSGQQGGGVLKGKIEQSSIATESISPSNPDPLVRQTTLEGTTSLVVNKPLLIGSLDVPASTHHFDIEVVMEPVN